MKRFLLIALLLCSLFLVVTFSKSPSYDRDWEPYYEKTANAEIINREVVLQNVRNWNHNQAETLSTQWLDAVSIDVNSIETAWFGYSGFSSLPIVGHTFISFALESGEVYTLSIEARREIGETYHAWQGLFNTYELLYGWGTERDYVGVRVFLLEQPIEIYQLNLTAAEAQGVFIALAARTAKIARTPQFYNTITSNCTNELVRAINTRYPGRISYHPAHNLPGLSIDYLQSEGLINAEQRFIIPHNNGALLATIDETPSDFSRVLRELLAAKNTK